LQGVPDTNDITIPSLQVKLADGYNRLLAEARKRVRGKGKRNKKKPFHFDRKSAKVTFARGLMAGAEVIETELTLTFPFKINVLNKF
jgi:hypothetical protein